MAETVNRQLTNRADASGVAGLRRLAVNIMSLLTADVLNKAATFIVYAMVGRYCGDRAFGQLSLGLMLLYTFQVFGGAGLPTLITREVAKSRDLTGRYFVNACLITFVACLVSLAAPVMFVVASRYPRDTSVIILILGAGIIPWSLTTVVESTLRAWEKMHVLIVSAIPVNLARVAGCYWLLATGHGVESVVIVLLACHLANLLLQGLLMLRHVPLSGEAVDLALCRVLLQSTWKFLGIDSVIAVWGGINTVLLSWFAGEAAVGLFGAAWQLLVPVRLALQAVVNSLFPVMCRRAEESISRLRQITSLTLELVALITVPSCVLLYFAAEPLLRLIYRRDEFLGSVAVLRIMLPVLLLQAVASTLGQVLYSRRREHATLRIVTVDLIVNLLVGVPLVYWFGVEGAAVAVLLSWTVNGWLHWIAARECLADEGGAPLPLKTSLVWPIAVAGGAMALVAAAAANWNVIATSLLAGSVYLAAFAALAGMLCRGNFGFRERVLIPLREQ